MPAPKVDVEDIGNPPLTEPPFGSPRTTSHPTCDSLRVKTVMKIYTIETGKLKTKAKPVTACESRHEFQVGSPVRTVRTSKALIAEASPRAKNESLREGGPGQESSRTKQINTKLNYNAKRLKQEYDVKKKDYNNELIQMEPNMH